MNQNNTIIGFSMGDPFGVGPQITLEALSYFIHNNLFVPVIFGSQSLLTNSFLQSKFKYLQIEPYDPTNLKPNTIYIVDCGDCPTTFKSESTKLGGELSLAYIEKATEFALNNKVSALVTAPISKQSLYLANSSYTGHTTMLKALTQSDHVNMVFTSPKLNVVLVTIHISLKSVSDHLTQSTLLQAFESADKLVRCLGNPNPKIAVAGLNPHASEDGLFGHEESDIIAPAIDLFKSKGHDITGPYPGDTIFMRASKGEFDVVVAMYHDQGLIPVKLLGFYDSVNVTLGLPFIRTSPDHGTAFDRAYTDKVSAESMISATKAALKLIDNKDNNAT